MREKTSHADIHPKAIYAGVDFVDVKTKFRLVSLPLIQGRCVI